MAKRILVVEDDALNRMYLCAALEADGYETVSLGEGAHFLPTLRTARPDLITMDINLPDGSGIELIERLKAEPEFSTVPVLAITAYVGKVEESAIMQAGAAMVLTKPISIKPFLKVAGEMLDGRPVTTN